MNGKAGIGRIGCGCCLCGIQKGCLAVGPTCCAKSTNIVAAAADNSVSLAESARRAPLPDTSICRSGDSPTRQQLEGLIAEGERQWYEFKSVGNGVVLVRNEIRAVGQIHRPLRTVLQEATFWETLFVLFPLTIFSVGLRDGRKPLHLAVL